MWSSCTDVALTHEWIYGRLLLNERKTYGMSVLSGDNRSSGCCRLNTNMQQLGNREHCFCLILLDVLFQQNVVSVLVLEQKLRLYCTWRLKLHSVSCSCTTQIRLNVSKGFTVSRRYLAHRKDNCLRGSATQRVNK